MQTYCGNGKKTYPFSPIFTKDLSIKTDIPILFVRYSSKKLDVTPPSPNTHVNYTCLIKLLYLPWEFKCLLGQGNCHNI